MLRSDVRKDLSGPSPSREARKRDEAKRRFQRIGRAQATYLNSLVAPTLPQHPAKPPESGDGVNPYR